MPRRPAYPYLASVMRVARRAFPAERRARLRQMLFEWLDLTWTTPSGMQLMVATYGDWVTYNEVFVSGEYDRAIAMALDRADGGPLQVVDVGANVGYFSLRVVDRMRQRGKGEVAITAVEAHPPWVREFNARVLETNRLSGQVRIIEGLVGARSGTAQFHESSIFGAGVGVETPYVDLSLALADVPRIDLLKCDIEGAEQLFIETYPDLLRKVRVAVFEIHSNLCDAARCKRGLAEAGFTEGAVLRAGDPYFTYAVWR